MKSRFLFLFIIWGALLHAQSSFLENISIEHGLSQGFVPSVCQDDDGFLWVATKNGLNRYDGNHFRVFQNDPFDSLSISNNEVIGVFPAGDFLFVVAFNGDPMLFHRKTNCFYPIPVMFPDLFYTAFAPSPNVLCAFYSRENKILIYRFEWPADLSITLLSGNEDKNIFQYVTIDSISTTGEVNGFNISANGDEYWLVRKNNIEVFNFRTGFSRSFASPDKFEFIRNLNDRSNSFLPDLYNASWIIGQNAVARFDGKRWEYFKLGFEPAKVLWADRKSGLIWISSNQGAYCLDLSRTPFNPEPVWHLETGNPLICGCVDQSGILWLGTDTYGLLKFRPKSGAFMNYLDGISIMCKPVFNGFNHVLLTDLRSNVVGSEILDLRSGESRKLFEHDKDYTIFTTNPATENGYFWLTAIDNQGKSVLIRYHPESQLHEVIPLPQQLDAVHFVLKYTDPGIIWIFSGNQIIKYDIINRKLTGFKIDNLPIADIFAVEHTPDGYWWIGTSDGLIKAKQTGSGEFHCSKITAVKGNRNSLRINSIKSLLSDPENPGILWIGTNGGGLTRLNTREMAFTHFTAEYGLLPDNVVYGVLADDGKPRNLWISSNRGLTRLNPESGFSQFFKKEDGLQDNEFNTYASYKAPSGTMFFGGVNGLTVFNPQSVSFNSQPPQVKFTELTINGIDIQPRDTSAVLNINIAFLELLELPYYKNNLVLHFAAMDFTSPNRNLYNYYLEGAEKPWIHRGFEHSAQYLNLSPGTYTFWLKAANSSGAWSNMPISLKLVIRPPWYLTWPAYLVYAVLFAFAGFLFNQYQLIQRLKIAESKRLKNLDQFKTRFYTNITHEFRTPLTVILGITQQLINNSKDNIHPLTLIKRNGENLLRLINQILDLTKLESHDLRINYIQGDVLAYLRYISESMHSLANAQNVMLKVESSHGSVMMDYDPERLMQIIHNLLSNAIKFTPSGGRVTMSVNRTGELLSIIVEDTGIGIPQDMQPFLFDRFFQVKSHGTLSGGQLLEKAGIQGSTGIGLSLTRELVQIMGGSIRVESPGSDGISGTKFIVTLPVTNLAAPESQTEPPDVSLKPEPAEVSRPETDFKILLIEDNPDVMEYITSCLNMFYQLEFAYNGKVGIETAIEKIPDLIISDVMMPEKDGLEVCDFLKNDERTSHIPIILLTAKATLEDRLAGLRRGADVYLNKPFHEEELLVWVGQLIARQHKLRQRYANLGIDRKVGLPEAQPEMLEQEDVFVQKLKNILEENYTNPDFSVDDITVKTGMSRAQLYRKLNSLTGKTVTAHLNTIRLEKASELLKTGRLTVSEVAYEVGYNDPKYFGRLFAEAYGKTPGEFSRTN